MVRDLGFMFGLAAGVIWVIVTLVLVLVDNGVGAGMLAATLPAVIAIPQTILSRIEGGWGFVSRLTDRGLRMRRGLFSTRTDNLAPGRIQQIALRRPVLWRKPRWTSARVEVAGIDGDDEAAATNALPVGTSEELGRTVGYLLPSLGTDDDLATLEHLLDTSPREITGIRPRHRLFPIGRRTRRTQLYPGAAVLRSGVLSARIQVIPRERIQGLTLAQGPIAGRPAVPPSPSRSPGRPGPSPMSPWPMRWPCATRCSTTRRAVAPTPTRIPGPCRRSR
jgi:putative membrane protein